MIDAPYLWVKECEGWGGGHCGDTGGQGEVPWGHRGTGGGTMGTQGNRGRYHGGQGEVTWETGGGTMGTG